MKKNYYNPTLKIVRLAAHSMLAESMSGTYTVNNFKGSSSETLGGDKTQVKEQTNYNVWNEDWSN